MSQKLLQGFIVSVFFKGDYSNFKGIARFTMVPYKILWIYKEDRVFSVYISQKVLKSQYNHGVR